MAVNRYYSNTAVSTTLSGGINNSVTSMVVGSVSGFPVSYPYTLVIDQGTASEELVTVTNAAGTTLTVTRGADSTTATTHSAGASVKHAVSARDFREPQDHIAATTGVHGLTGALVGTTDVQTLTNKTIDLDSGNAIAGLPASSFITTAASGVLDGGAGAPVKAIPAGAVVGTTDSQTLSNKTLTTPTLTSPAFAGTATGLANLGGAWSTYTPSWTSSGTAPVIGNGTITGRYLQLGKLVIVTMKLIAGATTTTGTGVLSYSLPPGLDARSTADPILNYCEHSTSSQTSDDGMYIRFNSSTTFSFGTTSISDGFSEYQGANFTATQTTLVIRAALLYETA